MRRRSTRRDRAARAAAAAGRMRVLLLNWRDCGHPEGGGAETVLERVAAGLSRHGHQVTVRCAAYPGARPDEVVDGVRFARRGGRFTVYLRTAAYLLRWSGDFDVVVDVQNGMPFWAPLFSRAAVVNLTHHVHREQWRVIFGPVLGRVGWWLESRVAPLVYRRCRYLTVSTATREDLVRLGVDPRRISVIYAGVDPPALPAETAGWTRSAHPSMVVLGRLVPHKRVELALTALAALRRQWPDLTLTVIGQGYWAPTLRDRAAELAVSDAVRFTGFVDEAAKHRLLAEAWVHLMPSIKEGWGLAVIESGTHATPTVAFRTAGGPAESVVHGEAGLLVDGEDGFAGAIGALLADGGLRARLGRGAQAYAARFSWDETADGVEAELRAAAGLPRRPVPADVPVPGPRREMPVVGSTAAASSELALPPEDVLPAAEAAG